MTKGQEVMVMIGDCPVNAVIRGLPKADRPKGYRVEVMGADEKNRWHTVAKSDIIATREEEEDESFVDIGR